MAVLYIASRQGLLVRSVQNERDVIEVFSLQMPCIFEGILQNEKVLRVIGTLFGSVPMGLSFARVSPSPSVNA